MYTVYIEKEIPQPIGSWIKVWNPSEDPQPNPSSVGLAAA